MNFTHRWRRARPVIRFLLPFYKGVYLVITSRREGLDWCVSSRSFFFVFTFFSYKQAQNCDLRSWASRRSPLLCFFLIICVVVSYRFIGGGNNDNSFLRLIMLRWLTFPKVQLPLVILVVLQKHCGSSSFSIYLVTWSLFHSDIGLHHLWSLDEYLFLCWSLIGAARSPTQPKDAHSSFMHTLVVTFHPSFYKHFDRAVQP